MKKRYFILFLCAAILSYTLGCAPWVDQLDRDDPKNCAFYKDYTIYGEKFNVDTLRLNIIDPLYEKAEAESPKLNDLVTRIPLEISSLTGRKEGPAATEDDKGIEMVFVHLSDVQIRDERVKLFGAKASRSFDKIIPSFEHGTEPRYDQEHYDYAAYLALIRTINAYLEDESISKEEKPKFMIHTGDAVDAGVVEELYEFIYISNNLQIPWYNVLGNHDITVFGNFANKKIYVNNPDLTFQTLHNKFNFINMHGGGHKIDPNINPGPPGAEHLMGPAGRYHGFDLYDKKKNEEEYTYDFGVYLCRYCPGYYSFKMRKENGDYKFVPPEEESPPQNSQEIVFIVLNTSTTKFGFAEGTVDEYQLKWLEKQLNENKGKLILAFGHHPLDSGNFIDKSYKDLIKLFHQFHVIAYFCGHTHIHKIRYHEKEDAENGFWEVITDSILEYPQEGSLVTIRDLGNGTGAIDVQSISKNMTNECQLKKEADLALEDAKKDHFRVIDEQDRNARLIFKHSYFAD